MPLAGLQFGPRGIQGLDLGALSLSGLNFNASRVVLTSVEGHQTARMITPPGPGQDDRILSGTRVAQVGNIESARRNFALLQSEQRRPVRGTRSTGAAAASSDIPHRPPAEPTTLLFQQNPSWLVATMSDNGSNIT